MDEYQTPNQHPGNSQMPPFFCHKQTTDDPIRKPGHSHQSSPVIIHEQKGFTWPAIHDPIVRHVRIQLGVGCRSQGLKMCGKQQFQSGGIILSRRPDIVSIL